MHFVVKDSWNACMIFGTLFICTFSEDRKVEVSSMAMALIATLPPSSCPIVQSHPDGKHAGAGSVAKK